MPYGDHQDDQYLVFKVAEQPIITDSITPDARFIALKGFTESPWIIAALNSLAQITKNVPLGLPI